MNGWAVWPWNCLSAVLWMAVDDFHGFRSCMVRPWHPGCPWRPVWKNSVESSSRSSKSGMHSGIWSRHSDLSGGGMPDLPAYVGEAGYRGSSGDCVRCPGKRHTSKQSPGEKTEKGRSVFKGASGYPGGSFRRPREKGKTSRKPSACTTG